jgi:hypothetical protein
MPGKSPAKPFYSAAKRRKRRKVWEKTVRFPALVLMLSVFLFPPFLFLADNAAVFYIIDRGSFFLYSDGRKFFSSAGAAGFMRRRTL